MSKLDLARLTVAEFIERFRPDLAPLSNNFAYYFAGIPLSEEDVKDYLEEPIAALPPEVLRRLPKIDVFLVPFLERNGNGSAKAPAAKPVKEKRHGAGVPPAPGSNEHISLDRPPEARMVVHLSLPGPTFVFGVKDLDLADYHYRFYQQIAKVLEEKTPDEQRLEYQGMLREEMNAGVHGEVDEDSWHHKQALRRRGTNFRRDSKGFREYAHHSFIDTLTLYLHGICCDIDVDTGPRQLPSRHLRKRLLWMEALFPAPEGYAVFPEEISKS